MRMNGQGCWRWSWAGPMRRLVVACLGICWLVVSGFTPAALALDYKQENLPNSDFSGQDLRDANFTTTNLYRSNLSHANLQGVRLFSTNLTEANLEGADLRFAVLDKSRLVGANLTNANLAGAFAFNAMFKNAIIDGADFTDTEIRPDTQQLLCEYAKGKNPITGVDTRESLGCD